MNKKLLFGLMSLAALAACTNDDFDSQQQVAEGTSPIQFEVINNNEGMRASMDGNTVVWNVNDGDLFTLYHGAPYATPAATTGYQNATYKANANEGGVASLTTPSVILPGSAIMVWPVDTTLRIKSGDNLTIKIPAVQGGKDENGDEIIQHQIPYVSDVINIQPYAAYSETAAPGVIPTAYKTAGKDRKYQIYMRPMASQLNLNADYAGSDATIAQLYEGGSDGLTGEDAVDKIAVSSVDLLTLAGTDFTTEIPLQFAAPTATQGANWGSVENNVWTQVTDFNVGGIVPAGQTTQLTTECLLKENKGCKFLILPQTPIGLTGVNEGAVVVNTNYGKVVVAPTTFITNTGKYSPAEIANAWYRITNAAVPAATAALYNETAATAPETSGEFAGKFKTTANVMQGMAQVIDAFSANVVTSATSKVKGEPTGAAGTRYVKVLLKYLDMTDLHIKSDKQLRDAARVWKKMGLDDVTVYLDGDATTGEFEISQKTIKVINDINASIAGGAKSFKVMPCTVGGEACTDIVVTGGGKLQDIAFIEDNAGAKVNVVLNAGETWKWNVDATTKIGSVKVQAAAVTRFINKGTLVSDADATLKTFEKNGTTQNNVPLRQDGTWNVTAGKIFVQFTVTNYDAGVLNISAGAEYRQDGTGHLFNNWARNVPTRFGGDDSMIATVNNSGVFATVNGGTINNYGLIEHASNNAKTYITTNQRGGNFNTAFNASTNKMGRINLKYSNKDEDNISISAAANQGFVSVTIDGEVSGTLNATAVGTYVNYIIVNSGVTEIAALPAQIKYVEIDDKNDTEIAWNLTAPATANYLGLMVLSPVNIKLGTTIQIWDGTTPGTGACYLGADMYVGGTFNNGAAALPSWNGYYGNTTANFATMYVTY